MTVPSTTRLIEHDGDDSTTVFPYGFVILYDAQLVVTLISSGGVETEQTLGVDYTVSGTNVLTGGSVTMTTPPPTGETLRLERVEPLLQQSDFRNQGQFTPQTIEDSLDRVVMMLQQVQADVDNGDPMVGNPLVIEYDASNYATLTVSPAGNLGIESTGGGVAVGPDQTNAPGGTLHVVTETDASTVYVDDYDDLIIENAGDNAGMSIVCGSGGEAGIQFYEAGTSSPESFARFYFDAASASGRYTLFDNFGALQVGWQMIADGPPHRMVLVGTTGVRIQNVATPSGATDAANKGYVDAAVAAVGLEEVLTVDPVATIKPEFGGGINLGTSGVIESDSLATTGRFVLDVTETQNSGVSLLVTNSADSEDLLRLDYSGALSIGYPASALSGAMMSFNEDDAVSGIARSHGMIGAMTHGGTGVTVPAAQGYCGVAGVVYPKVTTGLSPNFVMGVIGTAVLRTDADYAGKVAAGVVGGLSASNLQGGWVPANADTSGYSFVDESIAGKYDHAACIWANAVAGYSNFYASAPTNAPLVMSGVKSTIPEMGADEVWAFRGDGLDESEFLFPKYISSAYPLSMNVAGAIRLPWPRDGLGTRKTHVFAKPGDSTQTASNVLGDLCCFDGGAEPVGWHEHDGTAFRKLTPQIGAAVAVTGGVPAVPGGITGGPAAANQSHWVQQRFDDGTPGGFLGWVQVWT